MYDYVIDRGEIYKHRDLDKQIKLNKSKLAAASLASRVNHDKDQIAAKLCHKMRDIPSLF